MKLNLDFESEVFTSLIGGRATIDTPCLRITSVDAAKSYLKTYGYDVEHAGDLEKAWAIHARAINYLQSQLLVEGEALPDEVVKPKTLENLLIIASAQEARFNREACAVLRVMHVIAQLENDLFNHFSLEIQAEILKPFERYVDGNSLKRGLGDESIELEKFEIKHFKNSDSAITKLLARPDEVAFGLLDKIGVRFVTRSLFDVFRVMRFLVQNHVVSPANIIPNQSNNTLYPVNLFTEVIAANRDRALTPAEFDRELGLKLEQAGAQAEFLEKKNRFTAKDYRFVKFITRQLVRVRHAGTQESFSFFYPYEVQIIDFAHYVKSQSGLGSHDQYKARQRERARQRVFS